MSKPSFPKNNPFKDALSSLKEELTSSKPKVGLRKFTGQQAAKNNFVNSKKNIAIKVPVNSGIFQNDIDDLAASLRSAPQNIIKKSRKEFDRPSNLRHRSKGRDESAIEALRNPLDRLALNPSGKPLVKRIGLNPSAQKPPPTKQVKANLNRQLDLLKIIKVPNPPTTFTWAKSISKVDYQFNFSNGEKFQPIENGDEDRDMTIGFDFGTSSSKVTIRDQQARRSFAIKFGTSNNLGDFLLPSKIYLEANKFYLSPVGQEFANLKF